MTSQDAFTPSRREYVIAMRRPSYGNPTYIECKMTLDEAKSCKARLDVRYPLWFHTIERRGDLLRERELEDAR
jgi:hypothetical protein